MTRLSFLVLLLFALRASAIDSSIPFGRKTWVPDGDDARWWRPSSEAKGLRMNAHYIAGPEPGKREEWLRALHAYRKTTRENAEPDAVLLDFRGVRAWVRMDLDWSRALALRPGDSLTVEATARPLSGNHTLCFAFDWQDRQTNHWVGWSTVRATLSFREDGDRQTLQHTVRVPEFDPATVWPRLIVGMDATHDPTPGRMELRSLRVLLSDEQRARVDSLRGTLPQSTALDDTIYRRSDLRWSSRDFVCHFTFLYDDSFYDRVRGRYRLKEFLDEGTREFGGYDALVLWQAYPRIGVDERNQLDFYRDLPGGLRGVRRLVRQAHARGVKIFLDYNPWDTGTRREGKPDEEALADLIAAVEADGLFLDTMSAGSAALRRAIDAKRRGVVFEPEGHPAVDQLAVCNLSWAQWLQALPEPALLHLKWLQPRHTQHQIRRWNHSHAEELESAFFNGSGALVWENVFGTWNPWRIADRATLRRVAPILRTFASLFTSGAWDPCVPTLVNGVYANRWPGKGATVWTLVNRTGRALQERVLEVPHDKETRYYDLWSGAPIQPEILNGRAFLKWPLERLGCVAAVDPGGVNSGLKRLLSRQHAETAGRETARTGDAHSVAVSVIEPLPVEPTPLADLEDPPAGMVFVPGGTFTMRLSHPRRECGCYPDPGTPPERWAEFLWGDPFNGALEHDIGPMTLHPFFIDETEVTNSEFKRFLESTGYRPPHAENFLKHWRSDPMPPELADHPVVYIDLDDARAYARWAGKRLPTEAEWHFAAQGTDGRKWPWGNEFDASRCNDKGKGTTPVKSYPEGRSPFGCYDMVGNVWEWTESERSDGHTRFCVLRGGSYFEAKGSIWYVPGGPQPITSHAKFLLMWPGLDRCSTVGFRCVKDVKTEP
ncbi:MAG: SUMF1/EgtB/PvdO family nonheme iron enzyme [Armatimonadetes bacterium]|nr:SUMF1/EgtB/PvdO family nonheme iron enzyme [Armatimonadota bacterium]